MTVLGLGTWALGGENWSFGGAVNGAQNPFTTVEVAICIPLTEYVLVGPSVSELTQCAYDTAVDKSEVMSKDDVPVFPHQHQHNLRVSRILVRRSNVVGD